METLSPPENIAQKRVERAIKLAPVLIVIWSGVFLLNGRAFRDGYRSHFHLSSSMFDDDVSGLITMSVNAWFEVILRILQVIAAIPFWGLIIVILTLMSPLAISWVSRRHTLMSRRRRNLIASKSSTAGRSKTERFRRWSQREFFSSKMPAWGRFYRFIVWRSLLVGYLGYMASVGIAVILIMLVVPFSAVGERKAAQDEANHFVDAPGVALTNPDGRRGSYKVITCAPRFCALYSEAEVITVPASAVVWGVSKTKAMLAQEHTPNNQALGGKITGKGSP